jgi:hypothetical protein
VNGATARHKRSLWFTAFVTSLALPLSWYCIQILATAVNAGSVVSELKRAFVVVFLVAFPFMLCATFLLALPALLLLRELRRLTAVNVCAVGGAAGVATVTIYQLARPVSFEWTPMAIGLGLGIAAGVEFALIAGIAVRRLTP